MCQIQNTSCTYSFAGCRLPHLHPASAVSGARALLDPRAWGAVLRGGALTTLGRFRAPAVHQDGGHLGLPADFLIDTDGTVIAAKYGAHADDQWSVDELLVHARAGRTAL